MEATRFNQGKPQWSLLPKFTLRPLIDVLEYGCSKYAPDNWKKGLNREEILESMQRHLDALFDGEEIDPDDKKHPTHHIGHIMANCVFYMYFYIKGGFVEKRQTELGAKFK